MKYFLSFLLFFFSVSLNGLAVLINVDIPMRETLKIAIFDIVIKSSVTKNIIRINSFDPAAGISPPKRKKLQLKPKSQIHCETCGAIIARGTYGNIFQHKDDRSLVVKGSINLNDSSECEGKLQHEYQIALQINESIQDLKRFLGEKAAWLHSLPVSDFKIKGKNCFFTMDRLIPIDTKPSLIELRPGWDPSKAGQVNSWEQAVITPGSSSLEVPPFFQYGPEKSRQVLYELNIPFELYNEVLGFLYAYIAKKNKLILQDVEFIVARNMKTGLVGIYLVDFDKVISFGAREDFLLKHSTDIKEPIGGWKPQTPYQNEIFFENYMRFLSSGG